MKRRCLGSGLAVLLMVCGAGAYELNGDVDVMSAHVFRGETLNDGVVIQPSAELLMRRGLGVSVWGNWDLDDYRGLIEVGSFSKVVATGFYTVPCQLADVRVGAVFYGYHGRDDRSNTHEAFVRVGREFGNLLGQVAYYYDVDEVRDYYGDITFSYGHEWNDAWSSEVSVSVGYAGSDMSTGTKAGWNEVTTAVELTYAMRSGLAVGCSLIYTDRMEEQVLPESDVDLHGGVHIAYHF
jgi:hypothetical protein